jgi:hypothetical protein
MPALPRSVSPLVLLFLAALQFLAAGFARLTGHGQSIEDISARGPETPAGYAFAIWFVIFGLSVAYGAWHAFKGKDDALCQRLSTPAALLFFLSSLWMVSAQVLGDGWHLVFIILVMWVLAVKNLLTLTDDAQAASPIRHKILEPLFGLYAGWLSAAIFLNITGTASKYFGTMGMSPNEYALFSLIPAGALSVAIINRTKGHLWFTLTGLWAVHAIATTNLRTDNLLIVSVCCFLAAAILGTFWVQQKTIR